MSFSAWMQMALTSFTYVQLHDGLEHDIGSQCLAKVLLINSRSCCHAPLPSCFLQACEVWWCLYGSFWSHQRWRKLYMVARPQCQQGFRGEETQWNGSMHARHHLRPLNSSPLRLRCVCSRGQLSNTQHLKWPHARCHVDSKLSTMTHSCTNTRDVTMRLHATNQCWVQCVHHAAPMWQITHLSNSANNQRLFELLHAGAMQPSPITIWVLTQLLGAGWSCT